MGQRRGALVGGCAFDTGAARPPSETVPAPIRHKPRERTSVSAARELARLGLWRWWRSFDQPCHMRPARPSPASGAHPRKVARMDCPVDGYVRARQRRHGKHRREPAGVAFPPRAAQQGDRLGLACASGVRAIGGRRPRFRQGRRSRRPRLSRTTTPGGARRIDRALDARERPWWSATRGGAQDFLVSQKISAISSILARSSSALPASISPLVPVAPASLVASLTRVCSCGYFSKCGGLK
jgi:hypothetical protein